MKKYIEFISNPAYLKSLNCIRRKEFTVGTILVSQALYDAYQTLIGSHNYIAAIQQIRMIIDNCIYLYAATLFENPSTFYDAFEEGKELSKLKQKGRSLTSGYLLSLMDGRLKEIYNECCDWIHPTNKRIHLLCKSVLEPENIYKIGYKGIKYKSEEELSKAISDDMEYVIDCLKKLLEKQIELQIEEASKITTDEQFIKGIDDVFERMGIKIEILLIYNPYYQLTLRF